MENNRINNVDTEYLALAKEILENGNKKSDRTNTGTSSVFGRMLRFDLSKGFPLLTTKRVPFRLIASELIWFMKGDTNIKFLLENNNHIWDEWPFQVYVESEKYSGPDLSDLSKLQTDDNFKEAYEAEMDKFRERILTDAEFAEEFGSIGVGGYGSQWRSFEGMDNVSVDQLKEVIEQIKNNPDSRRLLVSAWNPTLISKTLLPPCHYSFQFYVFDNKLSCLFNMRSTDVFLGLPFNIASYALLTHLIAYECGLEVGELVYSGADVHIYSNHIEQVGIQLERESKELPTLVLDLDGKSIFDIEPKDVRVEGYDPHPTIKAPVAI